MYQPHEQRVVDEKRDLDERPKKLKAFIEPWPGNSAIFDSLSPEEQELMELQRHAMEVLSYVLGKRIALFDKAK